MKRKIVINKPKKNKGNHKMKTLRNLILLLLILYSGSVFSQTLTFTTLKNGPDELIIQVNATKPAASACERNWQLVADWDSSILGRASIYTQGDISTTQIVDFSYSADFASTLPNFNSMTCTPNYSTLPDPIHFLTIRWPFASGLTFPVATDLNFTFRRITGCGSPPDCFEGPIYDTAYDSLNINALAVELAHFGATAGLTGV